MSKKVVISGYYGFDNFGDEAILHVLLENLKKEKHDITVLSKNPEKTAEKYNIKAKQTFSLWQVFASVFKSDVLISGGGSLLQDVTSTKSLIYYLFVIKLAQFFRKKVIIFAQGIGPVNNKFLQWQTKRTLKKCSYITVRDDKSLFLLRGWGLKPVLVNDPVWAITMPQNLPENKIGMQLRDWKTLSDDFLKELAKQININYSGKEICLFSFQNDTDVPVCEKFKAILLEMNPLMKISIIENHSLSEILNEISKLEALIAMRFHAVLPGIKAGIRTLAISYDIKVRNLAAEADIPCVILNENDKIKYFMEQLKTTIPRKLDKDFDFTEINKVIED